MIVLFANPIAAEGSVVLISGVAGGVDLCPLYLNLILTHENEREKLIALMQVWKSKKPKVQFITNLVNFISRNCWAL